MPNRSTARPLPDGWTWTTIGEVTKPIEKVKPKDEPDKEFTYLDISGIDNERNIVAEPKVYYGAKAPSRARQSVKAGDVLFSTVRTYLKNIAQVPEKYDGQVASTGFSILRGHEKVSNKYLFYFSLTDAFLNPLAELQRGTSYPAVRDSDVREQPIPLAPFPEQERIVAEIEKQFTRLDQAVASLRRLQSNLGRYKASVLKAACEGRLVPQDPDDEPAAGLLARILAERRAQWQAANPGKKYQEPVGVEETAVLPELPNGWTTAKLEEIILSIQTGPFGSSLHKSDYVEDGIPVINPASIIDGKINPISRMAISVDTRERLKGFILRNGDVIMGRRGEMGRSAMVTEKEDGWLCGTGSLILRFAQPISRQFMVYLFGSENVKAHLGNASVGTTMQNLNQKILLNMIVGLPPENEQKRIVDEIERRLSVVSAFDQTITANLSRAERLRQSILHHAFTGQLV